MHEKTCLKLDDFLPYRMSVAANAVSEMIATAYEALFGLKVSEWRIIAVLADTPSITPLALGGRTRMDKMTVSRAASALAERGLIQRSANPADRRSHLLRLTSEGERLYTEVAPAALELERTLLAGFDGDDIARFVATLQRLEHAARSFAQAASQQGSTTSKRDAAAPLAAAES